MKTYFYRLMAVVLSAAIAADPLAAHAWASEAPLLRVAPSLLTFATQAVPGAVIHSLVVFPSARRARTIETSLIRKQNGVSSDATFAGSMTLDRSGSILAKVGTLPDSLDSIVQKAFALTELGNNLNKEGSPHNIRITISSDGRQAAHYRHHPEGDVHHEFVLDSQLVADVANSVPGAQQAAVLQLAEEFLSAYDLNGRSLLSAHSPVAGTSEYERYVQHRFLPLFLTLEGKSPAREKVLTFWTKHALFEQDYIDTVLKPAHAEYNRAWRAGGKERKDAVSLAIQKISEPLDTLIKAAYATVDTPIQPAPTIRIDKPGVQAPPIERLTASHVAPARYETNALVQLVVSPQLRALWLGAVATVIIAVVTSIYSINKTVDLSPITKYIQIVLPQPPKFAFVVPARPASDPVFDSESSAADPAVVPEPVAEIPSTPKERPAVSVPTLTSPPAATPLPAQAGVPKGAKVSTADVLALNKGYLNQLLGELGGLIDKGLTDSEQAAISQQQTAILACLRLTEALDVTLKSPMPTQSQRQAVVAASRDLQKMTPLLSAPGTLNSRVRAGLLTKSTLDSAIRRANEVLQALQQSGGHAETGKKTGVLSAFVGMVAPNWTLALAIAGLVSLLSFVTLGLGPQLHLVNWLGSSALAHWMPGLQHYAFPLVMGYGIGLLHNLVLQFFRSPTERRSPKLPKVYFWSNAQRLKDWLGEYGLRTGVDIDTSHMTLPELQTYFDRIRTLDRRMLEAGEQTSEHGKDLFGIGLIEIPSWYLTKSLGMKIVFLPVLAASLSYHLLYNFFYKFFQQPMQAEWFNSRTAHIGADQLKMLLSLTEEELRAKPAQSSLSWRFHYAIKKSLLIESVYTFVSRRLHLAVLHALLAPLLAGPSTSLLGHGLLSSGFHLVTGGDLTVMFLLNIFLMSFALMLGPMVRNYVKTYAVRDARVNLFTPGWFLADDSPFPSNLNLVGKKFPSLQALNPQALSVFLNQLDPLVQTSEELEFVSQKLRTMHAGGYFGGLGIFKGSSDLGERLQIETLLLQFETRHAQVLEPVLVPAGGGDGEALEAHSGPRARPALSFNPQIAGQIQRRHLFGAYAKSIGLTVAMLLTVGTLGFWQHQLYRLGWRQQTAERVAFTELHRTHGRSLRNSMIGMATVNGEIGLAKMAGHATGGLAEGVVIASEDYALNIGSDILGGVVENWTHPLTTHAAGFEYAGMPANAVTDAVAKEVADSETSESRTQKPVPDLVFDRRQALQQANVPNDNLDAAKQKAEKVKNRAIVVKGGAGGQVERGLLTAKGTKLVGLGLSAELDVQVWRDANKEITTRGDQLKAAVSAAGNAKAAQNWYTSVLSAWETDQAVRDMDAELAQTLETVSGDPAEKLALQKEFNFGKENIASLRTSAKNALSAAIGTSGQIADGKVNPKELQQAVGLDLEAMKKAGHENPDAMMQALDLTKTVDTTRAAAESKYRSLTKKIIPWKLTFTANINSRALDKVALPLWWYFISAPEWAVFSFDPAKQQSSVEKDLKVFTKARSDTNDRFLQDFDQLRKARLIQRDEASSKARALAVLLDTDQPLQVRLSASRSYRDALVREKMNTARAEAIADRLTLSGMSADDVAHILDKNDGELRDLAGRTTKDVYDKVLAIQRLIHAAGEPAGQKTREEETTKFVEAKERKAREESKNKAFASWKEILKEVQMANTKPFEPVPEVEAEAGSAPPPPPEPAAPAGDTDYTNPPVFAFPFNTPFTAAGANLLSASPDTSAIEPGVRHPTFVSSNFTATVLRGRAKAKEVHDLMANAKEDVDRLKEEYADNQRLSDAHLAALRDEARVAQIRILLEKQSDVEALMEAAKTAQNAKARAIYELEYAQISGQLDHLGYVKTQATVSNLSAKTLKEEGKLAAGYKVGAGRERLVGAYKEAQIYRRVGEAQVVKEVTAIVFAQGTPDRTAFGAAKIDVSGRTWRLFHHDKPDTQTFALMENRTVLQGALQLTNLRQTLSESERTLEKAHQVEQTRALLLKEMSENFHAVFVDEDHTPEDIYEGRKRLRDAQAAHAAAVGEVRAVQALHDEAAIVLDNWTTRFSLAAAVKNLRQTGDKAAAEKITKDAGLSDDEIVLLDKLRPYLEARSATVAQLRVGIAEIEVALVRLGAIPSMWTNIVAGPFGAEFKAPGTLNPLPTVGASVLGTLDPSAKSAAKEKIEETAKEPLKELEAAKAQLKIAESPDQPDKIADRSAAAELEAVAVQVENTFKEAKTTTPTDAHIGDGLVSSVRSRVAALRPVGDAPNAAKITLKEAQVATQVPEADVLIDRALERQKKAVEAAAAAKGNDKGKKKSKIKWSNYKYPFSGFFELIPRSDNRSPTWGLSFGVGSFDTSRPSNKKVEAAEIAVKTQKESDIQREWRQGVRRLRQEVATQEQSKTASLQRLALSKANYDEILKNVKDDVRFRGELEAPAKEYAQALEEFYSAWAAAEKSKETLLTVLGVESTDKKSIQDLGFTSKILDWPNEAPTRVLTARQVQRMQEIRQLIRDGVGVPDPKLLPQARLLVTELEAYKIPLKTALTIAQTVNLAEPAVANSRLEVWNAIRKNIQWATVIYQLISQQNGENLTGTEAVMNRLASVDSSLQLVKYYADTLRQARRYGEALLGPDWKAQEDQWDDVALTKALQKRLVSGRDTVVARWFFNLRPFLTITSSKPNEPVKRQATAAMTSIRALAALTPKRDVLASLNEVVKTYDANPSKPLAPEAATARVQVAVTITDLAAKLGVLQTATPEEREKIVDLAIQASQTYTDIPGFTPQQVADALEAVVKEETASTLKRVALERGKVYMTKTRQSVLTATLNAERQKVASRLSSLKLKPQAPVKGIPVTPAPTSTFILRSVPAPKLLPATINLVKNPPPNEIPVAVPAAAAALAVVGSIPSPQPPASVHKPVLVEETAAAKPVLALKSRETESPKDIVTQVSADLTAFDQRVNEVMKLPAAQNPYKLAIDPSLPKEQQQKIFLTLVGLAGVDGGFPDIVASLHALRDAVEILRQPANFAAGLKTRYEIEEYIQPVTTIDGQLAGSKIITSFKGLLISEYKESTGKVVVELWKKVDGGIERTAFSLSTVGGSIRYEHGKVNYGDKQISSPLHAYTLHGKEKIQLGPTAAADGDNNSRSALRGVPVLMGSMGAMPFGGGFSWLSIAASLILALLQFRSFQNPAQLRSFSHQPEMAA